MHCGQEITKSGKKMGRPACLEVCGTFLYIMKSPLFKLREDLI